MKQVGFKPRVKKWGSCGWAEWWVCWLMLWLRQAFSLAFRLLIIGKSDCCNHVVFHVSDWHHDDPLTRCSEGRVSLSLDISTSILISKALRMARVNEGSHLPPTRLSTNGMSHSAFDPPRKRGGICSPEDYQPSPYQPTETCGSRGSNSRPLSHESDALTARLKLCWCFT